MGTWNRDESGQIIIIAALLLAVIFVGLALVLNSAIYTENMATRGDTSTAEAMSTGSVTEDRLQKSIHRANYYSDTASYEERRSLVSETVTDWDGLAGTREARTGRMYQIRETGLTRGTRVNQSTPNNFMPAESTLLDEVSLTELDWLTEGFRIDPLGLGDKKNWIIANDTQLRSFEMTVQKDSLYKKNSSTYTDIIETGNWVITGSKLFWVEIDQSGESDDYTRVYLLDDADNSSVEAVVVDFEDGSGSIKGRCRTSAREVSIRLSEGTMVGNDGVENCPDIAEAISGHANDVYYAGADEVNGTYQFIANESEEEFRSGLEDRYGTYLESALDSIGDFLDELLADGELTSDDLYYNTPTGDGPYSTTAIYDVTVESTYQDDRITYTRNVTFPPAAR